MEAAVNKWESYGTLPIIEYMNTYGEKESPNATMKIEESYANIIDFRPSSTLDTYRHVKLEEITTQATGQNQRPCGILNLVDEGISNDKFTGEVVSNKISLDNIIHEGLYVNPLPSPAFSANSDVLPEVIDPSLDVNLSTTNQVSIHDFVTSTQQQIDSNEGVLKEEDTSLNIESVSLTKETVVSDKYAVTEQNITESTLNLSVESIDFEKE